MFSDAMSNLREDLALSDSSSEASLRLSWDDLANFSVCVLPDLTVILADAVPGTVLSFTTRAWIDTDAATFYVSGPDDVGDPASGAYAVATVFASDTRRIAPASWSSCSRACTSTTGPSPIPARHTTPSRSPCQRSARPASQIRQTCTCGSSLRMNDETVLKTSRGSAGRFHRAPPGAGKDGRWLPL